MARTSQEIEQEIDDAIAGETALNDLTSTSKVAIWRSWKKIIAGAIHNLELFWDAMLKELRDASAAAVAGTEKWYAERILEFQYGYALTEVNGKLVYLVDDPDAQIVQYVSVNSVAGTVEIKVAKDDSGDLAQLTGAELTSLESYIKAIKFAGTRHKLFSLPADIVRLEATAYYDGKLDPTEFETLVETTLKAYLKGIFFNGKLNINKLRDAAEAIPGMNDFQVASLEAMAYNGTSFSAVTHEYAPLSGYHEFDAGYPDITFVAQ